NNRGKPTPAPPPPENTQADLKGILNSGPPAVLLLRWRGAIPSPTAITRRIRSACRTMSTLDTGSARWQGNANVAERIAEMNATQSWVNIRHLSRNIVAVKRCPKCRYQAFTLID